MDLLTLVYGARKTAKSEISGFSGFRVSSSHASLLFREDRGENFTTECTENTEELLDMNDEI